MNEENRAKALEHAKAEYPNECCGLLVVVKGKERYVPCRNIAEDPRNEFTIAPEEYRATTWMGEIIAIVHSHVHIPPIPSDADRVACEASGMKWYITNPQTEEWGECEPEGYEAPLEGRTHHWGTLDCWTVVRDWYRRESGIELMNVPRRKNFWLVGENPLGDNWKAAGFVEVDEEDEMREGDVILMQTGDSTVPNHVALYLGDDIILHHAEGRLSSRDVYGGWYRKHTVKVVRYAEDNSSPRGTG